MLANYEIYLKENKFTFPTLSNPERLYNPYINTELTRPEKKEYGIDRGVKIVKVFSGFEKILSKIEEKYKNNNDLVILYNNNGNFSKKTRDSFGILIHYIQTINVIKLDQVESDSIRWNKTIQYYNDIPAKTFQAVNYRHYRKMLDLLIDENMIECDGKYIDGVKSFGYRLVDKYNVRKRVDFKLSKQFALTTIDTASMDYKRIQNDFVGRALIDNHKHIKFPSIEAVEKEMSNVVGSLSSHGKERILREVFLKRENITWEYYCDNRKNYNVSILEENVVQFTSVLSDTYKVPNYKVDQFRYYDIFTNIPKWIRNMITIDDEPCVDLDFSSLHPNFLILFKEYIPIEEYVELNSWLKGNSHNNLGAKIGKSRSQAKNTILHFLNTKTSSMSNGTKYRALFNYFTDKLPTLLSMVERTKTHGVIGYKETSRYMSCNEAILMENCMKRLHKEGIHFFQIFDAISVSESKKEKAKSIMNDTASELGLLTRV